jgi:hypothetical protein
VDRSSRSEAANTMSTNNNDVEIENARLAYTIIQSLLDSHEALSDLLVVMSHALDEDVLKALTGTNEWQKYLESKRNLETTRALIEKLTDELRRLESESAGR